MSSAMEGKENINVETNANINHKSSDGIIKTSPLKKTVVSQLSLEPVGNEEEGVEQLLATQESPESGENVEDPVVDDIDKTENAQNQAEMSRLQDRISELELYLKERDSALEAKNEEAKATQKLLDRAQRWAKSAMGNNDTGCSEEMENLLISNEVLRDENQSNIEKIRENEQLITKLSGELEKERKESESEKQGLLAKSGIIEASLMSSVAEVATIREALEKVRDTGKEREARLESLEEDLLQASGERDALKTDVTELQQKLEDAEARATEAVSQRDSATEELNSIRNEEGERKDRVQAAESKVKEVTSLNERLQSDLRLLYKKNKKDLQDLENKYKHEAYKERYLKIFSECQSLRKTVMNSAEQSEYFNRISTMHTKIEEKLAQGKSLLAGRISELKEKMVSVERIANEAQQMKKEATETIAFNTVQFCIDRSVMEVETRMKEEKLNNTLKALEASEREKRALEDEYAVIEKTQVEFLEAEHGAIVSSLNEELEAAQQAELKQRKELENIREDVAKQLDAKDLEIASIKTSNEELSENMKKATAEVQALQSKLSDLEAGTKEKDSIIAMLENKQQRVLEDLTAEQQSNEALTAKLQEMKKTLNADSKQRDMLLRGFEDQVKELDTSLNAQKKEYDGKLADMQKRLHSKTAEMETSAQNTRELKLKLDDMEILKSSLTALKEKKASLEKELDSARKSEETSTTLRNGLEDENATLRAQAKELQRTIDDMSMKNANMEGDLRALKIKFIRSKESHENIDQKLYNAEREKMEAVHKAGELEGELEDLKRTSRKCLDHMEALTEDLEKSRKDVENLKKHGTDAENKCKEVKQQLQKEINGRQRLESNGVKLMQIAKLCNKDATVAVQHLGKLYRVVKRHNEASSAEPFKQPDVIAALKQATNFLEDRKNNPVAVRLKR
eukprot:jgi/Bigna1/91949/estExt_fgenesh1_pg.C_1350009